VTRWLVGRALAALLLVLLVATATFVAMHALPGDPLRLLLDPRVPEAARVELRERWGLDEPLAVQYGHWLASVARGDWGTSFVHRRPAAAVVLGALPHTLALGLAALLVQLAVAVPLGVAAARRPGGALDRAVRLGSLLLYSVPTFWLALLALLLLAYGLGWFPAGHTRAPGGDGGPIEALRHLALPALVLGLSSAGALLRLVRAGLLEALDAEHLRAARARGLDEPRVVWLHGLRNAAGPLLQLLGLTLPMFLGGALVVEVVFSWPGLGRIAYQAVMSRDVALVLACTAWSAGLVVAGGLLADVLAAIVDPRQRTALVGGSVVAP
jgi:peptide/nickel transport system permease protein